MHSDPADARPAPPRQEINTRPPAASRLPVIALIAVGAVFAFGTSIWYAYQYGVNQQVAANPPLIKAEPGPTKLKPDDPGGMEVPDRDKLVYDRVTGTPSEPRTERLLPPADQPMAKPDAPPPPPTTTGPAKDEPATRTTDAPPPPAGEPADDTAAAAAGQRPSPPPPQTVDRLAAVAPAAAPPPPPPPAADTATADKAGPARPAATPPKQAAVSPPPKPQPAAKPAPGKTATTGTYRVQLASFRSSKAANDAWSRLRKSNISLLRDLTAHVTRVELAQKGTFYRLQAGSFAKEAGARSVCTELKARKVDCLVVRAN